MYDIKCPDNKDFQNYLDGNLAELKIIAFDNHLKECELCREAISGYKIAYLTSIPQQTIYQTEKPNRHLLRRLLPYAAAVIILATLLISQLTEKWSIKKDQIADNTVILANNQKTLMHKSNTDYWYVGNKNNIAFNDQIVSPAALSEVSKSDNNVEQVFIQVEESNSKTADEIVLTIKSNQSVPVFTYSKHTELKKN